MNSPDFRTHAIRRTLGLVVFSGLLTACAPVRFISDYDEPTDKALTAIQQSTDDFITKLIADSLPVGSRAYEKHKQFYLDADQQLRRLEFRVASIPKNSHSVKLVADIRAVLLGEGKCSPDGTSLQDLHCNPEALAKGPSTKALQITQRSINQTIGAAMALELAKRQGLEQNK